MTTRALEGLLSSFDREPHVRVVAIGKAAVGMGISAAEVLGARFSSGVLTASVGVDLPHWKTFPAGHPTPSPASEAAGRSALAMADATHADGGLLLVCLSGGASAMCVVPASGLALEDKVAVTRTLLAAGLDIGHINLVRRHLSAIKGGQLAARAGRTVTLAISDVVLPVEDDPAVIGSGPTVGDDTTFADAIAVLRRAHVFDRLPPTVQAHLEAGAAGRVPGPVRTTDPRLASSAYWVVASRQNAMRAAADTARRLGYHVEVIDAPTTGDARTAPRTLLDRAAGLSRPSCVIASGETTVRVVGRGKGGRNQEFALSALEPLAAMGSAALASIGTDGVDGPTDAAGALVDADMWTQLGPDARTRVANALADNDSYPVLESLRALVRSGPSGTNVGDIQVLLVDRPSS